MDRAKRVRYLRETVLHFKNRSEFVRQFEELNLGSLESWEYPRHGGLNEKSAYKLANVALKLNVKCNVEWLLWGMGEAPYIFNPDEKIKNQNNYFQEEINLLRKEYSNLVDTIVDDDAMSPYFLPGDHVAGEQFFGDELLKAIGKACIIQTRSGESIVRLLKNGNHRKGYVIVGANLNTKTAHLKNNELFSAAPIIWMRRKMEDNI